MKTLENNLIEPPPSPRRYPGAAPFGPENAALFFGRKQETRELFDRVAIEKMTVLFAYSGVGKTSLIQAGLDPVLQENGFLPLYFRFNDADQSPEFLFEKAFRKQYATWSGEPETEPVRGLTFWELLKDFSFKKEGEKARTPVLVLDQFEEFFTFFPNEPQRGRFVELLAGALSAHIPEEVIGRLKSGLASGTITPEQAAGEENPPDFRLLIGIRSDMLFNLDHLSDKLPTIFRSRYQLKPLSVANGRDAIIRPATREGEFLSHEFSFSQPALQEILGVLEEGSGEIDSFELQIFCSEIEDDLIDQKREAGFVVRPEFYGGEKGIHRILEEFYQKQISLLDGPFQAPAHRLLEDHLLNDQCRRTSKEQTELLKIEGVSLALLTALERRRLIRKEPRLGSFYFEIAHDALVQPIWAFRQIYQKKQAVLNAETEMKTRLEEAEKLRKEQANRRANRAKTVAAIAFAGLAFVAILKWMEARANAKRAEEQSEIAKTQTEKANESSRLAEINRQTAIINFEKAEIRNDSLIETKAELDLEKAQKLLSDAEIFTRGAEPIIAAAKKSQARQLLQNAATRLENRKKETQKASTEVLFESVDERIKADLKRLE